MAHAQKQDFDFRRKGRVHLNRRERQFSRIMAAEVCASAVVMLDTPCSEVVWRVLAINSIRQISPSFPPPMRYRVPSHFNWSLPPFMTSSALRSKVNSKHACFLDSGAVYSGKKELNFHSSIGHLPPGHSSRFRWNLYMFIPEYTPPHTKRNKILSSPQW